MKKESFLFRGTDGNIYRQTNEDHDDTLTEKINIPTRWVICEFCQGEGASSAYLGTFTREDRDEDPEFFEDYLNGNFDRPCAVCNSSGKVKEYKLDQIELVLRAEIEQFFEDEFLTDSIQQAEIAMGA